MNSSTFRPARRSFISVGFVGASLLTLVSAGGCGRQPIELAPGAAVGGASSLGAGASGGVIGNAGGSSSGGGPDAASGGGALIVTGGGPGSGGGALVVAGGGPAAGGAPTGSGGMGTGGSEPCIDIQPPEDPQWPGATCENWVLEAEACEEPWFSEYCDATCGRCVPEGTGGTGNEPEPEPCEDVVPPEDPTWPGATCENWDLEADACGEDWFAEYCDVTCGRCVPEGGVPDKPGPPDCSGEGLPNVTGGEGFATRYWDCCQTHCSQFNGQKCSEDGVSSTGDGTSSCQGGGSFACYSEAPHAVSECLSYGHIAKASPDCGGCYRIQFTGAGEHNENDPGSKLIEGKQMIVKVSNTGGDVAANQFDLMVPGGGVGQFNACSRQWGTNELGAQYGGFLSECTGAHSAKKDCVRQECMKIPAGDAREGCLWFVDWMEVADNPKFTSQPTDCPF